MSNKLNWIRLAYGLSRGMKEIYMQQYHAAQFLARAGKYLIPPEADDSHTSFQFASRLGMFVGGEVSTGKRLALDLDQLTIHLLEAFVPSGKVLQLIEKSLTKTYNEMVHLLVEEGIDVSNLKYKLHYETMDHPLKQGSVFKLGDSVLRKEVIAHRNNAEQVLGIVLRKYNQDSPIRVWPHHFDTGALIPLKLNREGEAERSLGLGWAMADNLVDEPYFYLSFWSADSQKLPLQLPGLKAGQWMTPGWDGATLRLSEILTHPSGDKQQAQVLSFFRSGIESIKQSINIPGL